MPWRDLSHLAPIDVQVASDASPGSHPGTDARSRMEAAAPLVAPPARGATLLHRMLHADDLQAQARGEFEDEDC